MPKKGPLGKAESFYVEEKYKSGNSIENIAKELDRTQKQIESYIKTEKIAPTKKNETIIEQQFVKQNGATIMTENASTMIDASKKYVKIDQSNCITKIK